MIRYPVRRISRGPAAAVVHLGGTRVLFHTVTMDDKQGVDFLRRVQPREAVPVHYDDYGVFRSPLQDFFREADAEEGLRTVVRHVAPGQTLQLGADGQLGP